MSSDLAFLAFVFLTLGVAQIFAGAGGVEPTSVRVG